MASACPKLHNGITVCMQLQAVTVMVLYGHEQQCEDMKNISLAEQQA